MERLPQSNAPVVKQQRVSLQVTLPSRTSSTSTANRLVASNIQPLAPVVPPSVDNRALIASISKPIASISKPIAPVVKPAAPVLPMEPRGFRPYDISGGGRGRGRGRGAGNQPQPPSRKPQAIEPTETRIRVPAVATRPNRLSAEDREKWAKGLQNFLYTQVLNLVEPNTEYRKKLVSPRSMDVWMNAFTHKSYNPNRGENYEGLEKIGDAGLKIAFTTYILKRYPHLDQKDLTLLTAHYLSKSAQAPISRAFRLDTQVLSLVDMNTHIFEDLLESFSGALLINGNTEFEVGAGYTLVYNLIVEIFRNIEIDETIFRGHPKSQVKELFGGLHWTKKKVEELEFWQSNADGVSGTMTLQFTPTALVHLQRAQMIIPSPILAVAEGSTQTVASNLAYTQALEKLNSLGITREWALAQRDRSNFDHPDLAPYAPTALARARNEGFEEIYFEVPRNGARGSYVQLIGRQPNGHLEILAAASNCSTSDGRLAVLRFYAGGA